VADASCVVSSLLASLVVSLFRPRPVAFPVADRVGPLSQNGLVNNAAGRTDTPMTNPTPDRGTPGGDASTPASPRATVRMVGGHLAGLNSALAVSQSPAFKTLAGLQQHPSFATLDALVNATSFAKTFDTPAIQRWSAAIGPHVRVAELAQVQSLGQQLTAALDAFAPQRAALAAAAVGLSRHQDVFAAQFGQIVSAQDSIARLVARTDLVKTSALFDTIGRYSQVQMQLGAFAALDHTSLLRGVTRVPGRRYDSYLDGLPGRPIARRAAVARFAGDAQSSMVIAECLTSVELDDDDRDELADEFTTEVLELWQTGPSQAREDLFAELAALEAGLPDFLKAAWEDIARDGPKAASKIAHCAVECIDHTLRAVAAVDDVMAWVAVVGEKPGWLSNGRPTRRAKVMFAMRNRSNRDARLAVSQVEALVTLVQDVMENLQSVKHGEAPAIAVMRGWVLATEGALSQLLLHG